MKALILGYVWPETNASAAGLRDWAIMEHFRAAGWEVIYGSPAKENEFSEKLKELGLRVFSCAANDPRFDGLIRELDPDVVVFDRFVTEEQFGWRVEENAPNALRVLDTQDLHCLRRAREAVHKQALRASSPSGPVLEPSREQEPQFLLDYAGDDFLREMSSIHRADLVWVISDFEQDLLRKLGIADSQVELLRFSYPEPTPQKLPSFSERRHFVSIGNFRHPPNADAVRWMKQEIWPAIQRSWREHADVAAFGGSACPELHLYGAYPSKEGMALDDPKNGFRVFGPAQNQYETLGSYRVLLAPLRFGAGIKGKISDSWWCGTPVVTTSIGAEGMTGALPFPGKVLNGAMEFARAAVELHESPDEWARLQKSAFELMSAEYSRIKNHDKLIESLVTAKQNLPERRRANWMGAMLRMNLHRSTKYFSRWIELKQATGTCVAP
jgi:glycosyltransferase involved in cell wall biosynthesis